MQKAIIKILLILIISNKGYLLFSQNLVFNSGFEDIINCPIFEVISIYNSCPPWYKPTWNTPNIFNSCDNNNAGIPENLLGFQFAHSGNGYAGIGNQFFIFTPPDYDCQREYITGKLSDTLKKDVKYIVRYYLNLSNRSGFAMNSVNALLTKDSIYYNTWDAIPLTPQIINNVIISDTLNWVKVQNIYTASGGEKYITIGVFKTCYEVNYIILDTLSNESYYYIDDVGVYEYKEPIVAVNAGNDKTICIGDSIQIGSTNTNNYRYRWHPATGLTDTTISNPIAKPLQTTTYYLYQWDYTDELTVDSVTITVRNCDTISKKNNLIIYPNPCKDNLYLEYTYYVPDNTSIYITNTIGQTLIKQDFQATNTKKKINIRSLSAGVYFCNVYYGKELVRVERIIVIKQ